MNIEEINEFIERKLGGKKLVRASELPIENENEMVLLFVAALLSSNEKAVYEVDVLPIDFKCFNRTMTDFVIEIK